MTVFLDTNVLLYAALDLEKNELHKREVARDLLARGDVALSMQVLQEFINQSIHPKRANRLSLGYAMGFVDAFRKFPVQETTLALMDAGVEILERCKTSFWDAMIIAAARAQGCDILYSKDLQDGRIIDGMRIVNPFR